MAIADINKWTFTANGQTIKAEGQLSDEGLRQLISLLQAPSAVGPAQAEGDAQPAAADASGSLKSSMASASRRYFAEVAAILDGIRPGSSLGDQSGWLSRDAMRIDQMPVRDVDPDLIEWGAGVSANLRAASAILDAGQQRVTASAHSAPVPVGSYSTGWYDTGTEQRNAQYRADVENYRRQNRQAAAQIRAQVSQDASKPLQQALDSRGKIRAVMVERYGNDFGKS